MITFCSASLWFRRCGLILLCLQLLLFVVCLEPFRAGTWFQTEPAMVLMFALGALNAIWLAFGIVKKWLAIERPVHPLLYGLLAWAGWQIISLPAAENPIRSWMGFPQLGEGSGWQIMLLLSVSMIMPLWQSPAYKKIILSVGMFSLCVATALHFNPQTLCDKTINNYGADNPKAPANWPDYLPFIAGWLWIAYASAPSVRTPSRHGWMVLIFGIVLLVGQNSSARAMMFPVLIISSLILWLRLIKNKPIWVKNLITVNKTWRTLALLGIVLPLGWLIISQQHYLFKCKNASLAERAIYNQVAVAAIADNPVRLIAGNGWANFSDDMFKYGLVDGLTSFQNGEFLPNSLWLYNGVFHSHSQPMEALLATGIIGFLIFITLPILAIFPLRKSLFWWCVPVFIVLNAMNNLWFLLPQVMAFQALGLAAICAARPARIRSIKIFPRWVSGICGVLALLLTISSYEQLNIIRYGERLKNIMQEDPNQAGIVDFIMQDLPRGGERMAEGVMYFAKNIAAKANSDRVSENDRDWYRNFLEISHRAALDPKSFIGLMKLEPELSMLLFKLPRTSLLDGLKPEVKANLVDSIIRFSVRYPQREDYIAPFLMSLEDFTNNDRSKQRDILESILKVAPNHRSALWLLGTMDGNTEMKKQAVKLGVERVYTVTEQELLQY